MSNRYQGSGTDLELADKVVLITGASDGLTAALAGRLLAEGAPRGHLWP